MPRVIHTSRRWSISALALGIAIPFIVAWPAVAQLVIDDPEFVANGNYPFTIPSPEELKGVQVDPRLRELVSLLDDDSFAVRDQATQQLADLEPKRLEVYALLAADDLNTEQRYRVLTVLRDILVKTPRGALGISMAPFFNNVGGPVEIRVDGLIQGLPAERVLQIGDVITQVDHLQMATYEDLHYRVQTKKPGEKVHLRVKRQRMDENGVGLRDAEGNSIVEEIDLDMELGSAELLDKVDGPGQLRRQSRVELSRRIEAEDAAQTFAPRGRPVSVQGGTAAMSRGFITDGAGGMTRELDPDVERHPWIRTITQQRQYINEGRMVETHALRESWDLQLASLFDQVRDPRLSANQRDELLRVIERFAELMGE